MDLIKKLKSVEGVSLLELIISISLFSILMLSSTQIFKMVVDGQRNAISAQNVQENMRYIMEKISKEARMAQPSDTDCLPAAINKVFNTANGSSELYFKNKDGDCVKYYLEDDRLKITVGGAIDDFITPAKIEVSNLKFYVADDLIGVFHAVQPYVTIMMDVKAIGLAIHEQKIKIQMTSSLRYNE
ncbi:hypothetical protein HY797_02650 [Candidatus Falkowbacteria bacterium]|nr:hypothetical protein [Candidatus Falkowbacteria bacterium]